MSDDGATTRARPLVSVVTITKNNLEGLIRTRASVAGQTYHAVEQAVEHVVIDAASDDGTRDWLESQEGTIQWISEPDLGRYAGMNKGVRRSSGALLWFLNAGDTFASPEVLNLVVADWQRRGWRWAYGCERGVSADGEVEAVIAPIPFRFGTFSLGLRTLPHQSACFESSLVEELGGYAEDFGLAADQLFMLRAALVSRPATIAEFLCDFDLSGAGSNRGGPLPHFLDTRRARRLTGTTLKGGELPDFLVTVALAAGSSAMRIVRSRLKS